MASTEYALQQQIAALYAGHHGWLQGWLRRRLGNACDAADLAQDTFIRLLTAPAGDIPSLREPRAYLATVAAQQARDMVERMQSNPVAVAANGYDALNTSIPSIKADCQTVTCTPAQLVEFDHNRWNAANQALLPSGTGQVVEISDGIFLVGVRWHDRQLDGATGWQTGTDAATVCGQPQADTRCFFLRYQA